MSGYDLMKVIKDQFPDVKLRCVSGYDDIFEENYRSIFIEFSKLLVD